MAVHPQISFTGGELDPALQERINLQKYDSGLKTARNVIISKTGGILSRAGRKHVVQAKTTGKIILHEMSSIARFVEYGSAYLRLYKYDGTLVNEESVVGLWTTDDFNQLVFTTVLRDILIVNLIWLVPTTQVGTFVRDFSDGEDGVNYNPVTFFSQLAAPTLDTFTDSATGYKVDYAVTAIVNGEESEPLEITGKDFPISTSESNTIVVDYDETDFRDVVNENTVDEFRAYRRPAGGGAYGLIGTTRDISYNSGTGIYTATFIDIGQEADFSQSFDVRVGLGQDPNKSALFDTRGNVSTVYQQRLLIAREDRILASRTGHPYNFYRSFPFTDDSAVELKLGTKEYTKILRMIDNDWLVVFTTQGVFIHVGGLTPTNLSLDKKGDWVIDERVPPLGIPGGVLFVDSATNTVRNLRWSEENGSYVGEELSIFSDHFFKEKRIVSWAFQKGKYPLLWVVFSDGSAASFTYEENHQMRAWTRHDSRYPIEYVVSTTIGLDPTIATPTRDDVSESKTFFVINKNGQRSIEEVVNRNVTVDELTTNPEADKGPEIAALDSMVSWSHMILDDLTDDDMTLSLISETFTDGNVNTSTDVLTVNNHGLNKGDIVQLTTTAALPTGLSLATDYYVIPVDANNLKLATSLANALAGTAVDITAASGGGTHTITGTSWENGLELSDVDDAIFPDPGIGAIGTVFRWFHPINRRSIDLEVTARSSDDKIKVKPSAEFPSAYATNPRLYEAKTTFTGLSHMNDETVGIVSDGYVLASPLNDIDNYPTVTVSSGSITLPGGERGAIVHIGRPYAKDVETLDINTVEQRPVLIESKTANKVFIKVHSSRGLFVGNKFSADDKVNSNEMVYIDDRQVDYELDDPILLNRYDQPSTKRIEVSLNGSWRSQGRVALREVDPVHFEILSIYTDIDDQGR